MIRLNYVIFIISIVTLGIFFSDCNGQYRPAWTFFYYDSLRLFLRFNPDNRLDEFILFRPPSSIHIDAPKHNFDSLAIPNVGALGLRFNISIVDSRKLLGIPKSHGHVDRDTSSIAMMEWVRDSLGYIVLTFENDSLKKIASDMKWVKLPKGVRIGTSIETVISQYGQPDHAYTSKKPPLGIK